MGKYIRKARVTGDVSAMEASQSNLGVRTRSKTLALQRLPPSPAVAPPPSKPDSCYLQLRSRRLEKTLVIVEPKKQAQKGKHPDADNYCENFKIGTGSRVASSGSVGSVSISRPVKDVQSFGVANRAADDDLDFGPEVEASFGENNLDSEPRERSTRESTPCSFIRGVMSHQSSANQTTPSGVLENVTQEIEEFFTHAEQQHRRYFIEKYNFDIKTDMPLPGRYEWVKVNNY